MYNKVLTTPILLNFKNQSDNIGVIMTYTVNMVWYSAIIEQYSITNLN